MRLLTLALTAALAVCPAAADPIRGINVGGWLVLEKWLGGDIWNNASDSVVDEWTLCESVGKDECSSLLQTHWETWFTEDTVQALAGYGINTLRIPIGYWAIDNNSSEPYVAGAMDYLDQAIVWARNADLKVWIDLHGAPGSQNGFENSGRTGNVEWQSDFTNMYRTLSVLKTLAAKYSASNYSDVISGLEIVNEPISWSPNDLEITRTFYIDSFSAIRDEMVDSQPIIIMHDSFAEFSYWSDMQSTVDASYWELGLDTHQYQVYTDSDKALDIDGHINKTCSLADSLSSSNNDLPTYVGEWSAAADICIYANGTTVGAESCDEDGCSCTSDSSDSWSNDLKKAVRRYVEAQLDVYESSSGGYFFWSQAGYGGWNFFTGVEDGWIPQPLSARKYPGQCGFTLSDMTPATTTSAASSTWTSATTSSSAWSSTSKTGATKTSTSSSSKTSKTSSKASKTSYQSSYPTSKATYSTSKATYSTSKASSKSSKTSVKSAKSSTKASSSKASSSSRSTSRRWSTRSSTESATSSQSVSTAKRGNKLASATESASAATVTPTPTIGPNVVIETVYETAIVTVFDRRRVKRGRLGQDTHAHHAHNHDIM
ncbi:glycoside hydrolase superfamily [Dipodascopsis tothii]|uniref:glycoside hydrolase superfamily n=1 Tax=Dipodascopsis tothii TaxID=44089 RepID=UPI0034CEC9D0